MNTIQKAGKVLSVAALFTLSAHLAVAKEAGSQEQAEAAVKYRQSLYQLVRSNMAPLGAMAKGQLPFDTAVMQTNAVRLEQLADMMYDYLRVDTRKFTVDTSAKDAIWANFSEVEGKIDALRTAAINLQDAVEAGDESQYRAAIGKVGASCKGCHDSFKAD